MRDQKLLRVEGLFVSFYDASGREARAVRGVELDLAEGQTLGIAGESGSGKSLTALSLMGLLPLAGRLQGSILWQGKEWAGMAESEYARVRGSEISMVFQDPSTALNPVLSVETQLVETILCHQSVTKREARAQALEALRQVEIPDPELRLRHYPHQFSGGMKQRVMIAMALACEPRCLILDEPTTALDVTVQAQILDLVERLQKQRNFAVLLISHDLGVLAEIADEIAVMYAGRVVERARPVELLAAPRHPYTRALLGSIPKLGRAKQPLFSIPGIPPLPGELPPGCPFHPRCSRALERCQREDPPWGQPGGTDGGAACWNPEVLP